MRHFIVFVLGLLLFGTLCTKAQSQRSVRHYDIEDGLPQKTIVDIAQDKNGFMWFATPNMISKFNGLNFYSYGLDDNNTNPVRNNKFYRIKFDAAGCIWITTRENRVFRFDPEIEKFINLDSLPEFKKDGFQVSDVINTACGNTWIIGGSKSECYCFKGHSLKPVTLKIPGQSEIRQVFDDAGRNTWVLTTKGIYLYSPDLQYKTAYFQNKNDFFCAKETADAIWFGAGNGMLYRYLKSNRQFYTISTNAKSAINVIERIDDQHLFIAAGGDFSVYNLATGTLQNSNISALSNAANTSIRSCYVDRQKNVWIETNRQGIAKFNPATGGFKHFVLKTENFADHPFSPQMMIWEDIHDRLWIQQHGGGFGYYDAAKDQLVPISNMLPPNTSRFSGMLYAGCSDKQGNLWVSSKSQGIDQVVFPEPIFSARLVDTAGNNNVRSIMEDRLHRIWVGTKDDKITIFTKDLKKIGCLTTNGTIGKGPSLPGMPYAIITDWQGNIWIGTKGSGIYKLVPNKSASAYTVHHYGYNKTDPYSLSDNKVYSICQDSHHNIWIGTYSTGLNLVDNQNDGRFYNYRNQFKNFPIKLAPHIRSITEDTAFGMLYLSTTKGLMVFPSKLGTQGVSRYRFYRQAPNGTGLNGHDVFNTCVTTRGEVYVAVSGGINHVIKKDAAGYPVKFTYFTTHNGLISDLTSQVCEDHEHKLWIISESVLMRLNPSTHTFENYPDIAQSIKGAMLAEGGDITTQSGHLLLGTTGGLVEIYPDRMKKNTFSPNVTFTAFQLANRRVPVGPSSPLQKDINEVSALTLNHKQNFITIEYAALDFSNTKQIKYAYRLDGIDSTWVGTRERSAKYINIPPGHYVFHVRSTNSRGLWLNNERRLEINIQPAIWQTWWAKVLYVLIGLALVISVSRWIISLYRLKDRLQLEKEQTEMKTSFFTDVSHEIRTPLTLIVSPVENILETEKLPPNVANHLKTVLRNSRRMLRLVNQILDFRKIQAQLLVVREIAIGEAAAAITTEFFSTITNKCLNLKIKDDTFGQKIWVDADSLEKLLLNLLSNIVKYTPADTTVELNLFVTSDKLALQVRDHGHGMSKEIVGKLFSRFVSYNPDKANPSTGIGLSIVKEIVDRHGAEIHVESYENVGSTFTILFLTGVAHFANLPNIMLANTNYEEEAPVQLTDSEPAALNVTTTDSILLIEDDDELRHYIGCMLREHYKVYEAADGVAGLEIARQNVPDFIISDIMMPKMSGIDFLDALRSAPAINHIPLIFLTAKADPDTEVAAYEHGADGFITKPFSVKMLKLRIGTIMAQRKRLYVDAEHKTAVHKQQRLSVPALKVVDANERFLTKTQQEILKNISNNDFGVDNLISIMPMSRSVFVKKLKSLTGQSPVEYIRGIKIKHAASLLDTDQYSVKEISHMIGINDTKYFSQRFKEVMGVLPSEYKSRNTAVLK
ncbi:MAG: hybrid sensor histidine kinase/response regulator transcription factor [Mucilaginibacter sp.]